MKSCRIEVSTLGCLFIVVMFSLCFVVSRVSAQSPVTTQFYVECVEVIDEHHYILHFGYWSDGVEDFTASSTITTTAPDTLTTAEGEHAEWVAEMSSADVFGQSITFIGNTTHELPLNAVNLPACEVVVIPTDEPTVYTVTTVDDCPAWAVESATGDMICLWDLPKVGQG